MTRGKNADSAMPKNHLKAIRPPKLCTAVTSKVIEPNVNIMQGSVFAAPNFLPARPRNGAVRTSTKVVRMASTWRTAQNHSQGTKKTDRIML